ncbi:MAG: hypothetical protein ACRETX_15290, partial [Steroidobacteraceae bacterium]
MNERPSCSIVVDQLQRALLDLGSVESHAYVQSCALEPGEAANLIRRHRHRNARPLAREYLQQRIRAVHDDEFRMT